MLAAGNGLQDCQAIARSELLPEALRVPARVVLVVKAEHVLSKLTGFVKEGLGQRRVTLGEHSQSLLHRFRVHWHHPLLYQGRKN